MYERLMRYAEQHPERPTLWLDPELSDEECAKLELEMFGKVWGELSREEIAAYREIAYELEEHYEAYVRKEEV